MHGNGGFKGVGNTLFLHFMAMTNGGVSLLQLREDAQHLSSNFSVFQKKLLAMRAASDQRLGRFAEHMQHLAITSGSSIDFALRVSETPLDSFTQDDEEIGADIRDIILSARHVRDTYTITRGDREKIAKHFLPGKAALWPSAESFKTGPSESIFPPPAL